MLCIILIASLIFQFFTATAGAIDCAPSSHSFTLKTSKDIADINTCATFAGNLVVAADGPEDISLDGITSISGNLDVENVAQLRSLSSQSLTTVSTFTLNNLPKLSNLSFPTLANFSTIKLFGLPALEEATITPGRVESEVQEVSIFNTSITSLDWIAWPLGSLLNVTSNVNLQRFTISYGTINAGSTLAFSDNAGLENFTVSQLVGIYGALQLSANPKVEVLSFDNLDTIGGYVQLSGDYKNVSMGALNQVSGALTVDSTGDISALCSNLDQKASSHILKGHYECKSNTQNSPTVSGPSTRTMGATASPTTSVSSPHPGSGDGNGDLSNGAKIAMGVLIPLVAIVSSFLTCLCYRRRLRSKVQEIDRKANDRKVKEESATASSTESETGSSELNELASNQKRVEISSGRELHELDADYMPKELDGRHGKSEIESPMTAVPRTASWWSEHSDAPLVRHELPA